MLKIVAVYLCLTIFLVSGNGNYTGEDVDKPSAPQPEDEPLLPREPTGKPLPPTPPTTTKSPPITTTPIPTTHSTTSAPPSPNITTSTEAPITTTTVPPRTSTTSAPPSPNVPSPKRGEWFVNNGTTEICIILKMAVQFNVTYLAANNKTLWHELNLPIEKNETSVTGNCSATEQTVHLTWHNSSHSLMIHFLKNDTTKNYYMHHVEVSLAPAEFPNLRTNATLMFVHEADQFSTKLANSYKCSRLQELSLKENGTVKTNSTGLLKISDLQFQAFRTDNTTTFGAVQDCIADVPDVVPIAVGCALTALVIIVLAAYLVGRRRSQARGYVSM